MKKTKLKEDIFLSYTTGKTSQDFTLKVVINNFVLPHGNGGADETRTRDLLIDSQAF